MRADSITDTEGLNREKTRILPRLGALGCFTDDRWIFRTVCAGMGGSNELTSEAHVPSEEEVSRVPVCGHICS